MKKFVAINHAENPFKSYYFATDIEDLKEGDLVVVDTSKGYQIGTVAKYVEDLPETEKVVKWVVQRVDLAAHLERLRKQHQMAVLKNKMDSRRKELAEIQLFALLAKDDPSMKDLFDEYLSLSKEV